MTEERADRLRRVMDATGENAEALSTPWLSIDRETRVGRSE